VINLNEKSRIAYNKKADEYDNSREGQFTRNIHLLLLSKMNLKDNQSVLDVACGTGSLLKAMNRQKMIKGIGIDIADRMIKNATIANPCMDFYVSGCEMIPLPDDSIDIITVCAAYHHFPNVAAFSKEAGRVLKQNAMIYIADVFVPSFLRVILNPFVPLLFTDGDVRFYSPNEISDNFKRFGFEESDITISGSTQIVTMRKL
jgi:ubiquinone/menaquinone biosynthesis C-methylase UbiE